MPPAPSPSKPATLLLALAAATAAAQTHKIATTERVTRAVGVYEYTGDLLKPTAARLIPVTLFIGGHLEDAGVYLSRPVPFTLQTGIVYSIERSGDPIGTLDLEVARNVVTRRSTSDDAPLAAWYGYGRFQPPAPPAPAKASKASTTPSKVTGSLDSGDDEKPVLLRREDSAPATSAKPGTTASNIPPLDDDPERPTLRHRDPVDPNQADAKRKREKPGGYVSGPSTSLNDDPNRPSLHRGIPAAQLMPTQLDGNPPVASLHQLVAISDPANHDPHLFTREWASPTEHTQTLADLQTLARNRIATYLTTNHLTPENLSSRPKAHGPIVGRSGETRRLTSAKPTPAPLTLNAEDLRAYTLSYGGLPTFVYTAASPIQASPIAVGSPVYLTLIAQRLPSGELQIALTSITDAAHLDRIPWLRPIDAVDIDWSHRASLLFELRAQSSRQFALYRLVTAQAEQTFLSGILQ